MIVSFFRSVFLELTAAFRPTEWRSIWGKLRRADARSYLAALKALSPQMALYYILLAPPVAAPLYDMMLFHPTMSGPYDAHAILGRKIENVSIKAADGYCTRRL